MPRSKGAEREATNMIEAIRLADAVSELQPLWTYAFAYLWGMGTGMALLKWAQTKRDSSART